MKVERERVKIRHKSGILMLAYGKKRKCLVEGRMQDSVPFVGVVPIEPGKRYKQVGIGILLPETYEPYGLFGLRKGPKIEATYTMGLNVIQAWRAMKVLEQVNYISTYTLEQAWDAMDNFGGSFADPSRRDEVLDVIREKVPPNIDRILRVLRRKNITIDIAELNREVESGRLPRTPEVRRLLYHRR